jgi:predicted permease
VNPGFQPHSVMTASLSLPSARYDTPEKQIAFFRTVLDHLSSAPGVRAAGAGYPLPFGGGNSSASFQIDGHPTPASEPGPHGDDRHVTRGFFTALSIPLLKGRLFTDDDRLGSERVVVIDENLAHEYWPNQDPIGQRIRNGQSGPWSTIVGVVGHIRFNQLAGEESSSVISQSSSKGVYYFPINQTEAMGGFVIAKSSGDPAYLAGAIRQAVHDADPNQPVSDMKSMDTRITESLGPQSFAMKLLAVFAALAILLAAVGLYGLISYSVAQRTSEIGLRMALGAQPSEVLRLVLGQGAKLLGAGAVAGIVAGLILVRAMQSLLYGVSAADPLAFLGATVLLAIIALVASYIPARRAMRVDPIAALRCE